MGELIKRQDIGLTWRNDYGVLWKKSPYVKDEYMVRSKGRTFVYTLNRLLGLFKFSGKDKVEDFNLLLRGTSV